MDKNGSYIVLVIYINVCFPFSKMLIIIHQWSVTLVRKRRDDSTSFHSRRKLYQKFHYFSFSKVVSAALPTLFQH